MQRPQLTIQAILVKRTVYPSRKRAWRLVRHFIPHLLEYDPGKDYQHFIARPAAEFARIRTFTPNKLRGVKIRYGPLKGR